MAKNPKIAGVLNFIVPGLGYIYAETREIFGWIVLLSMILLAVYTYYNYITNIFFYGGFLLLSAGFAFDIYTEIK